MRMFVLWKERGRESVNKKERKREGGREERGREGEKETFSKGREDHSLSIEACEIEMEKIIFLLVIHKIICSLRYKIEM